MHALLTSVAQLLSEEVAADVFSQLSDRAQRFILTGLLGDDSTALVAAILQSVKQVYT